MQRYIPRVIEAEIKKTLRRFPVVAILGPRQCGKSTLARRLISKRAKTLYLDLELDSDINKLREPELFLSRYEDRLVCLDEIQRLPDIFRTMRGLIDRKRRNGRFLILGSASRDLIRQSSESLAGRICYLELTPFMFSEVSSPEKDVMMKLWLRGGFPESFLNRSHEQSMKWRENFIRTFLERDIPQLGFSIPASSLRRLWQMLAHHHGQVLNSSRLGESIGVSHTTIRSYVDLLSQTFMIRVLPPFYGNIKKRLVKAPKVFIRDSGILHALLAIRNQEELFGHPVFGSSWEGFAMENVINTFQGYEVSYYRTSSGTEIDLLLERGQRRIAFEFKASKAPTVSKGFYRALDELSVSRAFIIAPVEEPYHIRKDIIVCPLKDVISMSTGRGRKTT
jgi:hypothetical protein